MKMPAFLFRPESIDDMVAAKMPLTRRPIMPTGMTAREMAMKAASSGFAVGETRRRGQGRGRAAAIGGTNQIVMPTRKRPAPR
jgi:hypothetical protein